MRIIIIYSSNIYSSCVQMKKKEDSEDENINMYNSNIIIVASR